MLHSWDFAKLLRDMEAGKYGKIYYRRDNNEINYGWQFNVGQFYKNHFCFDCIGIIKSVCNGWKADKKATAGGCKLDSYIDLTEIGLLKDCTKSSTDFKNICVGEYLYMQGHGGTYVGTFKAGNYYYNTIEVAIDFGKAGIMKTWVDVETGYRYSHKGGQRSAEWLYHGMLSKIDYSKKEKSKVEINVDKSIEAETIKSLCITIAKDILAGKYGNNPNRKQKIITEYGNKIYKIAQKYIDNGYIK